MNNKRLVFAIICAYVLVIIVAVWAIYFPLSVVKLPDKPINEVNRMKTINLQ